MRKFEVTTPGIDRRRALGLGAAALSAFVTGHAPSAGASPAPPRHSPRGGSRLDAGDVQVLFADLQTSLVATSTTVSPVDLSRSAAVLVRVAAVLRIPISFSVVPESNGPPLLLPALRSFATDRNTILRTPISPFHHPPTVAALSRSGRRTLVVASFAAEAVVIQSALDALASGYRVFYVVDAVGSGSGRTEEAAFRDMERAGAAPTSVLSLATRLVPDFVGTPGAEVFSALQPLLRH